MQCFGFISGSENGVPRARRSPSANSNTSNNSTDQDGTAVRRSGSESSCNLSDISSVSPDASMLPSSLAASTGWQRGKQNDLRIFTFQELRAATNNFCRTLLLGEGGFGCVYRGVVKSVLDPRRRLDVAVKILGQKGLQGQKEWQAEVNILGIVEHQNLVKLIGYCAEDNERGTQLLLVYEFMPNGSLEHHISSKSRTPLSWQSRLKIALDTARGLKYLHEESEVKIIFRDLKPSNILLDEKWNAKLSDFGLARLGPTNGASHVSTAVLGTVGYAAPEYIHTGRLTTRSDAWSYGIVLYELITGRRPLDKKRPREEQSLLEWIKPYISDVKKFHLIIDPRVDVDSFFKPAIHLSVVANRCLQRHARSRPKMSEVYEMVYKIVTETFPPTHPIRQAVEEDNATAEKSRGEGKRRLTSTKASQQGSWLSWSGLKHMLVRVK